MKDVCTWRLHTDGSKGSRSGKKCWVSNPDDLWTLLSPLWRIGHKIQALIFQDPVSHAVAPKITVGGLYPSWPCSPSLSLFSTLSALVLLSLFLTAFHNSFCFFHFHVLLPFSMPFHPSIILTSISRVHASRQGLAATYVPPKGCGSLASQAHHWIPPRSLKSIAEMKETITIPQEKNTKVFSQAV